MTQKGYPLHHILRGGETESLLGMVSSLLAANPDLAQERNENGALPFHVALKSGVSKEILDLLLRANPDIFSVDEEFNRDKHKHIVAFQLSKACATADMMFCSEIVSRVPPYDLRYILNDSADLSQLTLYHAAMGGSEECFSYLLKKGADLQKTDANKNSLLHQIAQTGSPAAVKLCIAHGMDVDNRNRDGKTAFDIAVM